MTEKLELYRCEICGNIVQILHEGADALVCCGKSMVLLKPNTQENVTLEYHIPVYLQNNNNNEFNIQVGKEPHPMTEEHHIEFIERISKDKKTIKLQYLCTDDEPNIPVCKIQEGECAIEYCNLHGLWEGKYNA